MREIADREELDLVVADTLPQLVWYSAAWCGPCRRIDEDALQAAADLVHTGLSHCDIVKVPMAVHIHSISRIPTVILFREGREVQRLGSSDTAEIIEWLKTHTAAPAPEPAESPAATLPPTNS